MNKPKENRTSEYRKDFKVLPQTTQELLKRLDTFDPQRLRQAFRTNLWKQENLQIPSNYGLINEVLYINEVYLSGLFDNMDKFFKLLYDMQILRKSYDALVNERDTKKCAKIMAGYEKVSFTDEARVNLEEAIAKLLDTEEIDRMPPMVQKAVLVFHTTDERFLDLKFTRDIQLSTIDNTEQDLLSQATEFQMEILLALIELSHISEKVTIGIVELKTEFNREILGELDTNTRDAIGKFMNTFDKSR